MDTNPGAPEVKEIHKLQVRREHQQVQQEAKKNLFEKLKNYYNELSPHVICPGKDYCVCINWPSETFLVQGPQSRHWPLHHKKT